MVKNVWSDHGNTFATEQCMFAVDATYLLIGDIVFFFDGIDIVNAEW